MTISNATGLASHCKCYIKRMHMDDFRRNYKQSMKSSLVSFFRLEFTKRPTYFAFRERNRLFALIILMGIDIVFFMMIPDNIGCFISPPKMDSTISVGFSPVIHLVLWHRRKFNFMMR